MFQLTEHGLELIEVAPGIDIERDILAHMAFKPHIHKPVPMDPRLFLEQPMDLLADLLNLNLKERINYDASQNILFVNLEAWSVRKKATSPTCRRCSSRPATRSAGGSMP